MRSATCAASLHLLLIHEPAVYGDGGDVLLALGNTRTPAAFDPLERVDLVDLSEDDP